ncbi:AAA family ATPase [Scatolibacter rhodanostii]|uniref:AAA family ATPase n=1 Tax=Scatolibacter rhodanostii TaxID=2014781 RepID=UPI000C081AB1|nr:AAA family ATPase [Scatolibacter rhodanostii]
MSDDIDSILNSLFRNGKLNLGRTEEQNIDTEKSLEEMEKINQSLSKSLQSSIAALTKEVERENNTELIFPEENEKVHIAELPKVKKEAQSMVQKLNEDFEKAASAAQKIVIGQDAFIESLLLALKRPYVTGIEGNKLSAALIIMGQNGTGRHLTLETLTRELHTSGVFNSPKVSYMDLSKYAGVDSEKIFVQDIYSAAKEDGQILVFEKFEKAHSNITSMIGNLFIEGKVSLSGRYAEQKGMLVDIGTALVPGAVSHISMAGKYLFLLTDKSETKILDAFGASFLKACNDICRTGGFSSSDIQTIARRELEKLCDEAKKRWSYSLQFDEKAIEVLSTKFVPDEGVESLQTYMRILHKALAEYRLRHNGERKEGKIKAENADLQIVFGEEILSVSQFAVDVDREKAIEKVKVELTDIIGLEKVKKYILSLEDNFLIQQIRREKGLKADFPAMHMIFTGNPGTGKTTVARLVSRYLKAIGVLSGGQLVEVTRADLVGKYVGHTAPLTQKAIASALGGVLFIDEAYSLFRGNDDSFGLEAIDTLVKGMEDNRDNLVVILAGYTHEMEEFLTANSGLKSRFPSIIEFEDYTAEELLLITKSMVKAKGYILESQCDAELIRYFDRMQKTGDATTNGNARMARNKLEEAILNCSRRNIAALPENRNLELIQLEDFKLDE